jgi:hypothetical protein
MFLRDVLGPLLFIVFINATCDAVAHSKYLLFADDIRIYRAVNSSQDCNLLQSDINILTLYKVGALLTV